MAFRGYGGHLPMEGPCSPDGGEAVFPRRARALALLERLSSRGRIMLSRWWRGCLPAEGSWSPAPGEAVFRWTDHALPVVERLSSHGGLVVSPVRVTLPPG